MRGQAMMEYLVTYGWAILMLVFVIALLVSSGVFSAGNFSVQECTFQPGLPCGPYIIYIDNSAGSPTGGQAIVNFTLTNGLGFPINVTGVNYTVTDIGDSGYRTIVGDFPANTVHLGQGDNVSFGQNFSGVHQPMPKEFRMLYATVSYMNCRNSPCTGPYSASGRISASVEQAS